MGPASDNDTDGDGYDDDDDVPIEAVIMSVVYAFGFAGPFDSPGIFYFIIKT